MKVKKKQYKTTELTKIILITVVVVISLIFIVYTYNNQPKYTETYTTIYVSKCDTLWDIAEEYSKPDQDLRDYIYKIKELNNMQSSNLEEGQELQIIIYEEIK